MAIRSNSSASQNQVDQILREVRFELMPFDSFEEEITHLPDGATIAITTSPQLGIEKTVQRSEEAAARGYDVVPHIAARYIEDRDELDEIATRLQDVGVTDIFVPGGDREEPKGEFESAYDMLVALDELGHEFEEVGISGYPEGHQFLEEEELIEAMDKKAPYATYIVTQLCFDPDKIIEWTDEIRDRGVELPVEVGIPGVMNYQRLLKISQKVGVGESVRFLKKTTGVLGFVKELLGSKGKYSPDNLVNGLASYIDDPHYNIRGIHIYTFNQTPDTEDWRHGRLNS